MSYAAQDAAVADSIVATLEGAQHRCWIAPRNITPGSQYADVMTRAVGDAKVFVLVLSEHASASSHVGWELERAASKRLRIIGLRTDSTPLTRSFEYFLSDTQWINVAALGVAGALTKLTQAVGQGLNPSSWTSPRLGAEAAKSTERKRKVSFRAIQRIFAAAVFLAAAAIVIAVLVRYWPSKQELNERPVGATATKMANPSH